MKICEDAWILIEKYAGPQALDSLFRVNKAMRTRSFDLVLKFEANSLLDLIERKNQVLVLHFLKKCKHWVILKYIIFEHACECDCIFLVDYLLKFHGISLTGITRGIIKATENNNSSVIKYLLQWANNHTFTYKDCEDAIYASCERKYMSIFMFVFKIYQKHGIVGSNGKSLESEISKALRAGHDEIVFILLKHQFFHHKKSVDKKFLEEVISIAQSTGRDEIALMTLNHLFFHCGKTVSEGFLERVILKKLSIRYDKTALVLLKHQFSHYKKTVKSKFIGDALCSASTTGCLSSVKFLLENYQLSNVNIENFKPIRLASEKDHCHVLKLLLACPNADASCLLNYPIKKACKNGHLDIVKILLQRKEVDPSAKSNKPFRSACAHGHFEIVKLLAQDSRVNPFDLYDKALHLASKNGHSIIVDFLITLRNRM